MTKKEESRQLIKSHTEELFDEYPVLILSWATGCGKSYAAINLQARMKSKKTFICVAEIAHIENWKDEYIKHGYEYLLETTEIFCYASLKKYRNKSCDLLLLDEMHHFGSENRLDIFRTIKYNAIIGLSATISVEDKIDFTTTFSKPVINLITMEMAIEMEILPKPKVYLIPLKLDNSKKSETIEFKRGRNINEIHCDYLQRNSYIYAKNKYPTLNLIIHCTQQEKYDYLEANYERARIYKRSGWLRHGGIRKKFLSDCKTDKLMEIARNLELIEKRFICFCGSIEQAEVLGKDNCIHSKKEVKSIIHKFQSKEINSLYAIKMLTEGQNLEGIEAGIIGQLDGTERPFVQRNGRMLRAEFPEIYVLYFRDTKDEDYLQNVINTIPNEFLVYL